MKLVWYIFILAINPAASLHTISLRVPRKVLIYLNSYIGMLSNSLDKLI